MTPDARATGQADARATGQAHARAALAGNPSDGYGGAVLAVTLPAYAARAEARAAAAPSIQPASELVTAAVGRFAREHAPAAANTEVRWSTTIPRGVGLGGSSAIVIAVLRALCSLYAVHLTRAQLAELALAVEVEELGIAAGLQDRVTQAYCGLVFMDFARDSAARSAGDSAVRSAGDSAAGSAGDSAVYQPLDPALLPPLLVGWQCDWGGDSGAVHAPLRDRFDAGEPLVIECLHELGELARRARDALLSSDQLQFGRCVDASFDRRQRMLTLHPRHVEMVHCARAAGARVNYAGSGGAIVAVCEHDEHRAAVAQDLRRLGCDTAAVAFPTPG
jgi:glucuronokinase